MFVWQIAVAAQMRGSGLAKAMLRELLGRDALRKCRYMETTVSPSNTPSRRLFYSLARELDAPVSEKALFLEQDFGKDRHEQETLIRIGPVRGINPEEHAT
jgi:L-2,4-diaminobutyric acid acetyltransferase